MKKQILCELCAINDSDIRRLFAYGRWHSDPDLPRIGERYVVGKSVYEIDCEVCRKAILKDQMAVALTTDTADRDYEWEYEFIAGAKRPR